MSGAALRPVSVIVFVGDSGLTHYAMSLARALAVHRRVELVTGRSYVHQDYPDLPCRVIPFFRRSRYYPLDLVRLLLHLLQRRDHIVLLQSVLKVPTLDALFFRLLRWLGLRCVMTVHDVLPHHPLPTSRFSHRLLYNAFKALIVHSERTRCDVAALGVKVASHVVPHGIYDVFDFDGLTAIEARARYSTFHPDDYVVLFFGRINRRKGIVEFLDLIDDLAGVPGLRFIVAGSNGIGGEDRALLERFEKVRVDPRCLVEDGLVPFGDVQHYFRMANVVVLPYREGTTSGVLKLALAFGRPVIAADVGDLGEALADDIGLLLPPDFDRQQFSRAVLEMRQRGAHFAACGAAVREKYAWPRVAIVYSELLRRLD